MAEFIIDTRNTFRCHTTQIQSLEMQVSQIAEAISARPQGTLPNNTKKNPNEQCNIITHQSGNVPESAKMVMDKASLSTTLATKPSPSVHVYTQETPYPRQSVKDQGPVPIHDTMRQWKCLLQPRIVRPRGTVNLIPSSIFDKLEIGEVNPRSVKYPRDFMEDVLVKVGNFTFHADFFILDMEESQKIPIILRRPFLATACALIDMKKRELKLRVKRYDETFVIYDAQKRAKFKEEVH